MKVSNTKVYLAISGGLLLVIGLFISFNTAAYLEQFSVATGTNINFFSELRSMGGSLLVFGMVALVGCINKNFEGTALFTTSLIFATYSVFRITAIAIDGVPGNSILIAALIEIVFGLIGASLLKNRKSKPLGIEPVSNNFDRNIVVKGE